MITEKRKKGIITVFALLLAAFIAGGVFSVSAKYTTRLSETNTYVQVSLKLDPNYTGATDTEWRTVSPVNGQAMPSVTPPQRDGYVFTGYYSADGSADHEQNDGNRYYKNDGTSYKTWDASCNMLYAGWEGTFKVTFDAGTNGGKITGTTDDTKDLYAKNGEPNLYSNITATVTETAPLAEFAGMRFDGWYTESIGGYKVVSADCSVIPSTTYTDSAGNWNLSSNITLYAQYVAKITFNATANGGTITSGTSLLYARYNNTALYSDSDATILASVPIASHTYTGLQFIGWYTSASGGTQVINKNGNINISSAYTDSTGKWIMTDDVTLYAQYAAVITFDATTNGGTIISGTSPLYAKYNDPSLYSYSDTNISFTTDAPKASHANLPFDGWYTEATNGELVIDKNGNILSSTEYTDAEGNWIMGENVTLYAQYKYHKITFWNMNSSSSQDKVYRYEYNGDLYSDSACTVPAGIPSATFGGRTASYWSTTNTGGDLIVKNSALQANTVYTTDSESNPKWNLTSDITLYAVWYTVNYYKDSRNLPDGYTELQYIASRGGQYIDTGVVPSNYKNKTDKFEIDFALKFSSIAAGKYIYRAGDWPFNLNHCFAMECDSNTTAEWVIGGALTGIVGRHSVTTGVTYNYDVLHNNAKLYVNGDQKGSTSGTFGNNNSLLFFSGHTSSDFSNERVYYLKITGNDVLLRDYVPAKNSGGTVGFYDKKNNSFISGSGGFVTEYYSQVFAYGEVGKLRPVVTANPADGLPAEQTSGSYDCGYSNRAGGTPDGWTLTKHGSTIDYDIGGDNNPSENELWTHVSGDAGNLTVDLYTVLSDPDSVMAPAPPRLTSMFHSGDKSTEYVYVEPTTEEGVDLIEEENMNE